MQRMLRHIFLMATICSGFAVTAKPFFIGSTTFCGRDTVPEMHEIETVKFERVEEDAYYQGGEKEWLKFLQQTIHAEVPANKNAPAGVYTVVVQFIVDRDGNLSDYKALTNHGFGMEAEVIRVLKKSSKWIPAKQNGRIVKAYRKQPVTFQVAEEKKKKRSKNN